jgi:ATP-dependent Zn protease
MSTAIFEFLVSWGPMLLLIGVWIFFVRRSGSMNYKQYVETMQRTSEAQLAELRLLNERLARIEQLLQTRKFSGSTDA